MATWEAVDLGIGVSGASSGVALQLDRPSHVNAKLSEAGSTVCLTFGHRVVVATLDDSTQDFSHIHSSGHTAIQRALDLIGLEYGRFYSTPDAHLSFVCWWHSQDGPVLHIADYSTMSVRSGPASTFSSGFDQSVEAHTDRKLPEWSECLRYLRYSQTEDDLYDAYRKAYLAAESLFSERFPQFVESGDSGLSLESVRRLEADGLNLAPFVSKPSDDNAHEFHEEQYKANRCAHNHAKIGKDHKLPGTLEDMGEVRDALIRLQHFLFAVLAKFTGRAPKTFVTLSPDAIDSIYSSMANMCICISTQESIDPNGKNSDYGSADLILIPIRHRGSSGQGLDQFWVGEQKVDELPIRSICSFGAVEGPDELNVWDHHSIPCLRLEGVAVLRVALLSALLDEGGARRIWSL